MWRSLQDLKIPTKYLTNTYRIFKYVSDPMADNIPNSLFFNHLGSKVVKMADVERFTSPGSECSIHTKTDTECNCFPSFKYTTCKQKPDSYYGRGQMCSKSLTPTLWADGVTEPPETASILWVTQNWDSSQVRTWAKA